MSGGRKEMCEKKLELEYASWMALNNVRNVARKFRDLDDVLEFLEDKRLLNAKGRKFRHQHLEKILGKLRKARNEGEGRLRGMGRGDTDTFKEMGIKKCEASKCDFELEGFASSESIIPN